MSKKRIHIDELFRRGLGNMQMPVAGDDWAVMQARLAAVQQKRKRRRAIWWWLFGLLVVAGGSLSVYSILENKESAASQLIVEETSTTLPQNKSANGITSSAENETFDTQNSTIAKDGAAEVQNSTNANNTLADNNKLNNNSTSSKGLNSNTAGTTIIDKDNPLTTKQNQSDGDGNNTHTKKGDGKNLDEGDNTLQSNKSPKPNDENPIPPTPAANQQSAVNAAIDSIPNDNSSEKEQEAKQVKEATLPSVKLLNKPSIARFGLGFAPAFGSWQLPQNTRYGQIMKQGRQAAYGVGASFTADFRLTDKWWIGLGVDVSNVKSRGSYNYTHQIYDSIPVFGPGGEIKGYFYTNFRDTAHNYNLSSAYTFISVPVQAWYNIPINQKTGILLGSNVQLNYLAMAGGEYINPNTLFSQKATASNTQFRKLNFSVAIQMGYYYTINSKWRFEGVLQLQQMGKSIFSNSVGADVRLQSIGVNAGIVYNLMRKKVE